MEFELNEEQRMLQKMVREFGEKEVAPGAAERDEKDYFDRVLFVRLAALGLSGTCFPEEYGGAGSDTLSYIMSVEEISKYDDGLGVTLSASVSLCSWPICSFGTEEHNH